LSNQFGELLSRSMKQHSDASFPQAQHVSNIAMLSAFNVSEPHHCPLLRSQTREYALEIELERNVLRWCTALCSILVRGSMFQALATPVVNSEIACHPK
jgi:hypothetical protein